MVHQWLLLIAKYTSLMVIKKFVSHISSHISGLSKVFFCLVQSQEACPDSKTVLFGNQRSRAGVKVGIQLCIPA